RQLGLAGSRGSRGSRRFKKVQEVRLGFKRFAAIAACHVLRLRDMIAHRYQDLVCWQLARDLEQLVFELTATGPVSKDFKFRDQIRDSSSSRSEEHTSEL